MQELKWNTPATRVLAQDGCFACHSNLTELALVHEHRPGLVATQHDVDDGRAKLNFSEWQRPQEADLQDVVEAIRGKDMPPLQYRAMHSEARLTDAQRQELEQGLRPAGSRIRPASSAATALTLRRARRG